MNLTISPYRYSIKSKPAFKANEEYIEKDVAGADKKYTELGKGCVIDTAIVCFGGVVLGTLLSAGLGLDNGDEFYNNVDSVINSNEIKKDTFTVTDVNKDKSPEMILYKKDGGRVVLDIKNGKILEEKTTFEEIE